MVIRPKKCADWMMPQDMGNPSNTEQCVWLDPECFDPHKLCATTKKPFSVASTPQWFMSNSDIKYPLLQVSHMFNGIPIVPHSIRPVLGVHGTSSLAQLVGSSRLVILQQRLQVLLVADFVAAAGGAVEVLGGVQQAGLVVEERQGENHTWGWIHVG